MKINKFKNWERDARASTYERDFKEICRAILHNELHIRRLMTEDGAKGFDGDAIKEISDTEQFIIAQKNELEFLKNIIENEK